MNDNKSNPTDENMTAIHTLESDLASAVRDENYGKNIIKIVTDPNKDKFFTNKKDNDINKIGNILTKKNIIIFAVLVILISSGAVVFYILNKAKNIIENPPLETETPLVSTSTKDTTPIIKNTNFLNSEILNSADFSKLNRSEIIVELNKIKTLLTDKKIEPNNNIGVNTNLTISQLFEKMKYSGNDALIRSFNDIYSFGFYSLRDNNFETYLLIEVNNFDLAFKSILDWEKYMMIDLKGIFIGNNEIVSNIRATTTKSTSSVSVPKNYIKKDTVVFVDRILKNYDIREYVKNEDNTDIIYGFINSRFLLITSGETSFIDIKDRLLKENIVR